jgi:beta-1,2-mannosidase
MKIATYPISRDGKNQVITHPYGLNWLNMNRYLIALTAIIISSCNSPNDKIKPVSWEMEGFVKIDSVNPILNPANDQVFYCPVRKEEVRWEARNVLNPSALVRNGKVYLIYRAQDNEMTSRLGLAVSDDGLHFIKQPEPVFYPDSDNMLKYEWKGGVEDPRIVSAPDGSYIMTYTSYDGKTARLCLASSPDLRSWQKHGPVLNGEDYIDKWSKSGAILSELKGENITAVMVNGKYWMYFGDTDIFMASSDDLIHWEPVVDEKSRKLIAVLHPRPGYFDSRLVEPGPYALLQKEGILLIYNGSNASSHNDPSLPVYTYAAGQALFDSERPFRLVERSDSYFIHPDKPYEKTGEVNDVCFVEGLIFFKNRWFLYYGTADSRIAVAVR